MDWIACRKSRIVKETKADSNKISSIKEIAANKIKAANALADEHYYGKISLLYDALREGLECLALENGFKIYNHECYTAFLKEILNESQLGDECDKLRIIRNGINYYGKTVNLEEGIEIVRQLKGFIAKIKPLFKNDNKDN